MTADIIPFPTRQARSDPLEQAIKRLEAWRNRPISLPELRAWMQKNYPDSCPEDDS